MKNEKLELLLNKVVAFDQPEVSYYKGFLYKDASGYYIKVVESTLGSFFLNDKCYLKKGDEQFITQADKPKLMRISLKSWHYKLMKFVLRDNTPTPKNMQNGCPYFWLLVLSILALPFVLLVHGIKNILLGFHAIIKWCLKSLVNGWLNSVDDVMAYELYWRGNYGGNGVKMPPTAKLYFKGSDDDFLAYFLLEKYKLTNSANPEEYQKKRNEMSEKWSEWTKEVQERRAKENQEKYERNRIENERRAKQLARREESKKAWEARTKPLKEGFANLFASIGKTINAFRLKGDWKVLIKRTKQIVGAIVTLIVLVVTYFAVNGITFVLMAFVDWSIANWEVYAFLAVAAAVVGLMYVLIVVVGSWLQDIINRYERGKKVWYIEPLIYLIWYPVKYIGLLIAYGALYVLWHPSKFIFYTFLWKTVLVNVGIFIWKTLKAFGKGLANSTGVFGEYFGASYSDYCPGIEWVDTEEEQK